MVVKAVAESAFVTSELPVILSLEMHCDPKQQNALAKMMVKRFGERLLTVRLAFALSTPPQRISSRTPLTCGCLVTRTVRTAS